MKVKQKGASLRWAELIESQWDFKQKEEMEQTDAAYFTSSLTIWAYIVFLFYTKQLHLAAEVT